MTSVHKNLASEQMQVGAPRFMQEFWSLNHVVVIHLIVLMCYNWFTVTCITRWYSQKCAPSQIPQRLPLPLLFPDKWKLNQLWEEIGDLIAQNQETLERQRSIQRGCQSLLPPAPLSPCQAQRAGQPRDSERNRATKGTTFLLPTLMTLL